MENKSENRICQNCKNSFSIEPEDFNFYEKIDVPPPTFCPECRTQRRLTWRNEMSLYKRKCSVPGHDEEIISIYSQDKSLIVYDHDYWWSDKWDPLEYGRDFNFSKSFFQQWKELRDSFPLQALSNSKATNSDYCNVAEESRDSYLCSGSWNIERAFYSNRISGIKDCSDLYIVYSSEFCYDDIICSDCYNLYYSIKCKNCVNSYFLYDCRSCINCFGCSNLRNKSYCMWNEQLDKGEYNRRLLKLDLSSHETIISLKKKFNDIYFKAIHRFTNQIKTINSTGDNLDGTKNCKMCFDLKKDIEDVKYVHWGLSLKDAYDSGPGIGLGELLYEAFDTGLGSFHTFFTSVSYGSSDVEYIFNCYGCSNLFGCIGLRNKDNCIFNKQYSKEEFFKLKEKIIEHMNDMPYIDERGVIYKYGEFFPSELSPFVYNETVAQDYFPLNKKQVLEKGFKWRDRESKNYQITIEADMLPDNLKDIPDSIITEIIGCIHKGECEDRCSMAYKITEDELNLYKRLNVPLPRLCFGCRHDERLRKRNPMRLWHRKCMKENCSNEFETSYAPDRPEIVYCEKCYNKEVY